MSDVALLNPEQESAVCQRMIDAVNTRISRLGMELTSTVLDRETYMAKIGGLQSLKGVKKDLQIEYDRAFKV